MPNDPRVQTFLFKDDGSIPNNPGLPLLYYEGVLPSEQRSAGACRELFARHNWRNSWVNGVYTDVEMV